VRRVPPVVVAVVTALFVGLASLVSLVVLLLAAIGFSRPDCTTDDPSAQVAVRIAAGAVAVLTVALLAGALVLVVRLRDVARLVPAVLATPVILLVAMTGFSLGDAASERIEPNPDAVSCF
jgi:hypothetical protein